MKLEFFFIQRYVVYFPWSFCGCISRTGKSDTVKVGYGQRIRASGFTRRNIGRIEARVTRRQIQLMGSLWKAPRV